MSDVRRRGEGRGHPHAPDGPSRLASSSSAGNHAWVLNGFSATRDPAFTGSFSVTYVYVMGPMYPRAGQSLRLLRSRRRTSGTRLAQLAHVLTPYHDKVGRAYSIWEGAYVTLNP